MSTFAVIMVAKADISSFGFGCGHHTATGNLTTRTGMFPQKEYFKYDDLDRLETVNLGTSTGTLQMKMIYAANGNITWKTGLDAYQYQTTRKHAIDYIESITTDIQTEWQSITYTAFNKTDGISATTGNDAYRLDITYGPDQQRWKTVLKKNNSIVKTVLYAGNYEKITESGVTKEMIYLSGGAIYVKQAGQPDKIYYTHKDHLGSIVSITDDAGNYVFKATYDAWGNQNPKPDPNFTNSINFHRGYTGHEHLPEFGLINMNGRMYDPLVGRFLSPDPYVQTPGFSQSYNRYSYARNNPLYYTDPSGEFLVGAIIFGAFMNTIMQGMAGNIHSSGDFYKAMGIGALSGAAGYGAGLWMSNTVGTIGAISGGLNGFAGGFAGGFVSGAGNAWAINRANFGQGICAGFSSGINGAIMGGAIGAISGGINAYKHGGNILTGDGAIFISDVVSNADLGVTEVYNAPEELRTNSGVKRVLNRNLVRISNYNVIGEVDVESNLSELSKISQKETGFSYSRRDGIIYKYEPPVRDDKLITVGGVTYSRVEMGIPVSNIYMSTHKYIPHFMKSLHHEFIHAWQWANFGYKNQREWQLFKEASAYRYSKIFYPSTSVPSYHGIWNSKLYNWPFLPFPFLYW